LKSQDTRRRQQAASKNSNSKANDNDNNNNKAAPNAEQEQEKLPPKEPTKRLEFTPAQAHTHAVKLAVYHCNRAAAHLHLEEYEPAVTDCNIAILLNPVYVKAYMRRSAAYEQTERTDQALSDAKKALELSSSSSSSASASLAPLHIRQTVARLQKSEDARMEQLKTETMDKLKDLGNSILGNFGLSMDNFQAKQDPNTGSYSINFNQGK
jgi:tetratricopeptide (TPR) repeat protein